MDTHKLVPYVVQTAKADDSTVSMYPPAALTCYELKDVRNVDEVAKCLKTVLSSKMVQYSSP